MPNTILYALAAFPVLSETFVSNEIRAMRAHGHRIVPVALAPFNGPCQPDDEVFRAETLALGAEAGLPSLLGSLGGVRAAIPFLQAQQGLPRRSLWLAGARLARIARREGARHIHAHFAHSAAATAIIGARLAGITCSFIGHGYDIYGTPVDLAAKLAHSDIAFATCHDMAADFRVLAPTARVETLFCGVDPARFQPGTGRDHGRLLAIGRLAPQKGYQALLRALHALPPEQRPVVDVVGDGPLRAEIRSLRDALGLGAHVHLMGARPSGWISEHAPAYRGFVAPYVITDNGDRDTGPLVVKEAMAMGLPVLASALMGIKEMVAPETGRLVPPGDVKALSAGLGWLGALSCDERWALGHAGRARVEAMFTLRAQAANLTRAIEGLAA
ncbi:MAG: glycosyltransferase [Roseococcus sp.]|nr:glycosyltransferase [Roseococcus sp.]